MPAGPPRCKICEHEHWQRDSHVFFRSPRAAPQPGNPSDGGPTRVGEPVRSPKRPKSPAQPAWAPLIVPPDPPPAAVPVTSPVTKVTESGTLAAMNEETPVTNSVCLCPTCGAPHSTRQYASAAERQRAYRQRKREQSGA